MEGGVGVKAMVCQMCMANEFREEDGALVCQYCGTRYRVDQIPPKVVVASEDVGRSWKVETTDKSRTFRVWATVCCVLSVIYLIMGFTEDREMFAPFGVFGVLAGMLEVLARSPKSAPCIFGKQKGLSRRVFVIISLVVMFLVAYVMLAIFSPEELGR